MAPQASDKYTAVNNVPESLNRIHTDEGAREYGYAGGLVPGIAMFSYACETIRKLGGDKWVDGGFTQMRYRAPVFDGGTIEVTAESSESAENGEVSGTFRVIEENSLLCGSGRFIGRDAGAYPGAREHAAFEPQWPAVKPLIGSTLVATERLGSVNTTPEQSDMVGYMEELGLDPGYYVDRGVFQLGFLARMYTMLINANFERVGPTIHAGTDIQVIRPIRFGESISVRGRVDRIFRRKGQGFWAFELEWVDKDETPCIWATHTAVYDVKKRSSQAA
jgi:acyl dehydratase